MNQPHAGNPAETYEQYFVPAMFVPWANILLEHAALQPGERVLDVACGTGIVARLAAPHVGETGQVAGLDMSPAMLAVAAAQAAASGTPIRWHEGDATALPLPDDSFDVVFCQHGLQFVPYRAAAVREMHRVLAPGGRVLVMALQALALHPVFKVLVESVARHLALPVAAFMTPFALCDAEELRGLFAEAGLAAIQVVPVSAVVRFPDPERFVPLAAISSSVAVPAFAHLEAPARAALLDAVRAEVRPTILKYSVANVVTFPMFAHVARGVK